LTRDEITSLVTALGDVMRVLYGVELVVEVDITPADWAQGRDPQLETAVRLALEPWTSSRAISPPDPGTGPRKASPPRPARNSTGNATWSRSPR
jgi:tricorn protease